MSQDSLLANADIARYVRTATSDVFSTMLGLELEPLPDRVDNDAPRISDGVLAFVGLAGPWTGAGVILCSAAFACHICGQFLMTEFQSVNEEVLDSMGELANMIIGNFKTMAEEHLGPLGLSIPTVIYGRNFTSRSVGRNDWIVIPFACGGEQMEIRVCIAPSKGQQGHPSSQSASMLA